MGSIGVANGDFFSQLEVNPVTGYYKTENIKKLYHWIEDRSLEYVEQNGITADSDGDVYLSVAPLRGEGGHLYEVTIPDNNRLYDWREMWYDNNGQEFDSEHQYNENNPYFIYMGNIPKKYLKLVR